nr:hypothetical protein [uncultured Porphyromonas sp.]
MKIEVNIEALKRLKETIASTEEHERQELISFLEREMEKDRCTRRISRTFDHWFLPKSGRLENSKEVIKIEGTLSELIALSNIFKER